jgi:hypothetical protein
MGMSRLTRIRRQILAKWKLVLSFRKKEWELGDYPVHFVKQKTDRRGDEPDREAAVPRYRADVVNWIGLCGTGNSPTEALKDLSETFNLRRAHMDSIPRPGKHVPIQFAARDRIEANSALADDFIHHVLELEWAWISDESSLGEFIGGESMESYYEKIRTRYGIDVSDIANGNVAEILERISAANQPKG